jgi:hypothetical protein
MNDEFVLELPVARLCQMDRCLSPSEFVFVGFPAGFARLDNISARWVCGAHRDHLVATAPGSIGPVERPR